MDMKKKIGVLLGIFAIAFVTVAFLAFCYFGNYYSYGSHAKKAMRGTDTVKVKDEDGIIFFDGPGDQKAMIFYPGARVATEAYAPLMLRLAEGGMDTFLVDMPLHFANFGSERASEVLAKYSYDEFIIGGHSLGGVVASQYLSEHPDKLSGIVLLASYPTVKIPDDKKFLSVLGSSDGVISAKRYEESKQYWPKDNSHDYLIFGGNHSGFGNYGKQDGDKDASIRNKTQWRQTASAILEYM